MVPDKGANIQSPILSPAKPRRNRKRMANSNSNRGNGSNNENGNHSSMDLSTGKFSLDLKTGLLLLALVFQWWDGRGQSEKQFAVMEVQNKGIQASLDDMKRLQNLQQYDMSAVKIALAEKGIQIHYTGDK